MSLHKSCYTLLKFVQGFFDSDVRTELTKVRSWGDSSNDRCISWREHKIFLIWYITFFDTISQVRKLLLKEMIFSSKEIIYFLSSNFKWSYRRNFDFYLSNCPLKESNQKNFDFCLSNCPLKESYSKKLWFLPVKLSFERKLSKKLWFLPVKLSLERKLSKKLWFLPVKLSYVRK